MSKLAPTSIKYLIRASIKAKGVIEKPDVIGAVFGQTEGLLGSELDLRELQKTGRIGRIEVNIKSVKGKSQGEIAIPSSLDSSETALIAATLETIERVGPCTAEIKLISVEDMRSDKRKFVVEKAQEILKGLMDSGVPDAEEISEQIREAVRTHEICTYKGLPCGPNVVESDNIIIVEGRADVLNLLKFGIKNAIAIEGTSVPPSIAGIAKEKTCTLFVDGDRGGQLIARELMQLAEIDFVAVAPEGKEVEELTMKEVYKALREKVAADQFISGLKRPPGGRGMRAEKPGAREEAGKSAETLKEKLPEGRPSGGRPDTRPPSRRFGERDGRPSGRFGDRDRSPSRRFGDRDRRPPFRSDRRPERPGGGERITAEQKELFRKTLDELVGTRAAYIFDNDSKILGKVPVSELIQVLNTIDEPYAVVFDGRVDMRLNMAAKRKGVSILVGMEKEGFTSPIRILDRKELEK